MVFKRRVKYSFTEDDLIKLRGSDKLSIQEEYALNIYDQALSKGFNIFETGSYKPSNYKAVMHIMSKGGDCSHNITLTT